MHLHCVPCYFLKIHLGGTMFFHNIKQIRLFSGTSFFIAAVITALMALTSVALAQDHINDQEYQLQIPAYPTIDVNTYWNVVDLRITNHSDDNIECNGSIFVHKLLSGHQTVMVWERISAHNMIYRNNIIFLSSNMDRVLSTYDNIFCYKIN